MNRISLDTSVLIEYINLAGSFHKEAKAVIQCILNGKLIAIIPHPVLVETYYVSTRIYEKLGLSNPEKKAEKFIEWLYRSPNFSLAESSLELAILAGKIKKKFNLALTDAYVLASSKLYHAKAVFKIREKEIMEKLDEIKKEYDVVFLEA
ncbi:MAG: PIN domain-containing protein [Nitrososphaerota archaeon]